MMPASSRSYTSPKPSSLLKVEGENVTVAVHSGGRVAPMNLQIERISIEDIAHALSQKARFGGHASELITVAQHSLLVSAFCDYEFQLEGLLHDAAEAYMPDVPRPLKTCIPGLMELEAAIQEKIAEAFGVPEHMSPEVAKIDDRVLETEAEQFGIDLGGAYAEPYALDITPLPWKEAKRLFIQRFEELTDWQ
jgi:hypothetical protein